MKILFISRAYPPVVGGIENQNYELSKWLSKIAEVKIIANKGGKKFLLIFLPWVLLRTLFLFRHYDVILLGDGVLGIVGYVLKLFYKKPVISVVHGLDLTFKNVLYQKLWVGLFIKKLDKLIAVGNETIRVGVSKGISKEKFVFVPNGVDPEKNLKSHLRSELESIIDENLTGKKVILTSGRLAKRKGAAWFIENVMPSLPKNIIYIISGDGPDKENIENVIKKSELGNQVKTLGYVNDNTRNILFNTSDLFVQPNIKIEGDMEGFGISVIEASACKLPVIASRLEGLKDAIKDGQNGFLVEPGNVDSYAAKINELLSDDDFRKEFGEKARQFVIENYSWDKISKKYLEEIKEVIEK
ncbi:glycosyltransferase family 4 protein [Patescibacteria group bacterium]